jgi:hypothetical protein
MHSRAWSSVKARVERAKQNLLEMEAVLTLLHDLNNFSKAPNARHSRAMGSSPRVEQPSEST